MAKLLYVPSGKIICDHISINTEGNHIFEPIKSSIKDLEARIEIYVNTIMLEQYFPIWVKHNEFIFPLAKEDFEIIYD